MVLRVTTSSNVQRWLRNWEKKHNTFKEAVADEPRKMAMAGKELGKNLAPRDTGSLINGISFKVVDKNKTGGTALIWVKPIANPENGRPASTYAYYHHRYGDRGRLPRLPHQKSPSTGDFHWMFIVQDELARRYGKTMLDHVGLLK